MMRWEGRKWRGGQRRKAEERRGEGGQGNGRVHNKNNEWWRRKKDRSGRAAHWRSSD